MFTGGRRGEVRAWNYKTGADVWQNTRLAPDPHNRRRHVVPGKDPKCTLLVYGVGDFDEEQLGDVLVARELTDSRPQWASVCPPTAAGSDTLSTWALVGLATAEAAAECLERSERWAPEFLTAESRSRGDDGRLLKIYKFDPARADERDLLGFGAMRMMRQDHGQPVTALALHETEHMQVCAPPLLPAQDTFLCAARAVCRHRFDMRLTRAQTAVDFRRLRGYERTRHGRRNWPAALVVCWVFRPRTGNVCIVEYYLLQRGCKGAVPRCSSAPNGRIRTGRRLIRRKLGHGDGTADDKVGR